VIYAFDEYELDAELLQLRRSGKLLKLDTSALRMLAVLAKKPGELVGKRELLREIWPGREVADNAITVAAARLRKALVPGRGGSEFVTTVYGVGYRLDRQVVVRATGEAPAAPRPSVQSAPRRPFVGRDRVVSRLRQGLDEAHGGRGRLCVLLGEPGIGKTRVIEALEQELQGGPARVAWGFCREAGETPPLWPWRELLRQLVEDAAQLELTLDSVGGGAALPPFMDAPEAAIDQAGAEPGAEAARYRRFELVVAALTRAAERAPCVMVLDDLHRADAASLELLSYLVDRIARTRLFLVASVRPAEQGGIPRPETPLARVLGHRNCERIALERLTPADVAAYVAVYVDDAEGRYAPAIHAKSEGNPFFMTELVRQLCDARDLTPELLGVSAAALDLVRQRVAQVDLETRGLLSKCAVIGRSFELSVLAEATGSDLVSLARALEPALRAAVIMVRPQARTGFTFQHELIRAALYEALAPAERRAAHLAVGEALARMRAAGGGIVASDLAYHFHSALPAGDLRQTVRYCREAAAAAAAVFGSPDVARFSLHGLEALQLMERPSNRLRLSLMYQAAIYTRPHDTAAFARGVAELIALAHESRDGEMLARAGALVDAHFGLLPLCREVRACMEHALRLLPPESSALRAVALAGLAASAPHCYRAEESATLVDEALALARAAKSRGALYMALVHRLHLRGGPDHAEEAVALAAEMEQMAQSHPAELGGMHVDVGFFRATHALTHGAPRVARAALEQAHASARQLRHGELIWHSERLLALLQANLGAGPQAWDVLEALHERAERSGLAGTAVFCAYDRAVLLGGESQDETGLEALRYDSESAPMFWAAKLRALACAGLASDARAALRAIPPERLASLPVDSQYLGTLGHLTRAALMLDEPEYCAALEPLLTPHGERFAVHLFGSCDGAVPQLLGMLAHHAGDTGRAVAHFEHAIEMNESAGLPVRAAEASLALASCLLGQGEPAHVQRAVTLARGVRTNASRLGMLQLGRTARALLQQARAD
jgi:DNA-binding winged helix-turn-helix (wHTH) protein